MKKQYVSMLAIILSASGFLFSCGDKKKNTGALEFDSIQVNRTAHLFGDTAKPACNLVISVEYPVKSTDAALKDTLLRYILSECFGDKYSPLAADAAAAEYTNNYVADYKNDCEATYAEMAKENPDKDMIGHWYAYYKSIKGNVQLYEKNLLVYKNYQEEYTGGAHGMYATHFLNLDLSTLKPLQLDDLFDTPDYREVLTDLIWNQLMAEHKVTTHEALEDLGFGVTGEVAPIENFYLSKDGITFFYNVYDIAPYVNGPVQVTIPYVMMNKIMGAHPILKELQAQ